MIMTFLKHLLVIRCVDVIINDLQLGKHGLSIVLKRIQLIVSFAIFSKMTIYQELMHLLMGGFKLWNKTEAFAKHVG